MALPRAWVPGQNVLISRISSNFLLWTEILIRRKVSILSNFRVALQTSNWKRALIISLPKAWDSLIRTSDIILTDWISINCCDFLQGEKIQTILKAANVEVEPYWPGLFAKALETTNIRDLITSIGSGAGAPAAAPSGAAAPAAAAAAPAAAPKAKEPEPEEESDEDMGLGFFD